MRHPRISPVLKACLFSGPALASLAAFTVPADPSTPRLDAPPQARTENVIDTYFDTPVPDFYRWMETPGSAELKSWMTSQNSFTRRTLDAIPGRKTVLARLHALDQSVSDVFGIVAVGDHFFYFRLNPGEAVPKVYTRNGLAGAERLLIDPNASPDSGGHSEVGWFEPSKDGRYLAYGVATGGAEWGNLRVIDVVTGQQLAENISRIWAGDGSTASWMPDNKSFLYLRFPELKEGQSPTEKQLRSKMHRHTLASNVDGDNDPAVFGFGVDPKIEVPAESLSNVIVTAGSDYAIANFSTVDVDYGGVYVAPVRDLARGKPQWKKIAGPEGQLNAFAQIAVHGNDFFAMTRKDAPRFKVLKIDLRSGDLSHASIAVPESERVIEDVVAAEDALYIQDLAGGLNRLRRLAWSDLKLSEVAMPFPGAIRKVTATPTAPGVLLRIRSWTHSNGIYASGATPDLLVDTGWQQPSSVDFSSIEAREVMAVSYDGTRVPLSILIRTGLPLDGSHPTLLDSYGAYGGPGTAKPYFAPMSLAWLERGGVLAIAHPRGGGEYGEAWHRAGMKETKLNTVYDTLACAQYLVDQRYTAPAMLAVSGASAGGIAVGGAIVWRPDLFAAAIDHAGATDTLRFEQTANGPDNVPEFGSVATPEGFHALYAMSPYAHVRDGIPYPATLLETGLNDPRVDSWIVAKMAARLQAATSSTNPVLLRVDFDTGHFGGTTDQTEQLMADEYSFLLWRFGDPAYQPLEAHAAR